MSIPNVIYSFVNETQAFARNDDDNNDDENDHDEEFHGDIIFVPDDSPQPLVCQRWEASRHEQQERRLSLQRLPSNVNSWFNQASNSEVDALPRKPSRNASPPSKRDRDGQQHHTKSGVMGMVVPHDDADIQDIFVSPRIPLRSWQHAGESGDSLSPPNVAAELLPSTIPLQETKSKRSGSQLQRSKASITTEKFMVGFPSRDSAPRNPRRKRWQHQESSSEGSETKPATSINIGMVLPCFVSRTSSSCCRDTGPRSPQRTISREDILPGNKVNVRRTKRTVAAQP